jgi:hypothetical protein
MKKKEFMVYRGDEFIDVGTLDELSKRLNKKRETLRFYTTPIYHNRCKIGKKRLLLYKLEEEKEAKS